MDSSRPGLPPGTTLLYGTPTGAHIHGTAINRIDAKIVYDFTLQFFKTPTGFYSGAVIVDGSAIKEDSLLLGYYYIDIHTTRYPTPSRPEIRGQIEF